MLSFEECLGYIEAKDKFSVELGLERVSALCDSLGNPQDSLKCIHIAGTNGKGSTSLLIANALTYAGYKVGKYISPAVYEFNERISIDGTTISDESLRQCANAVIAMDNGVSEFELVTAIAFYYFALEKCDYVVIEVGMGGRLDATNIIKNPIASVITLIDYDHTEYLGDTIEQIATEKCGIIKENSRVISYPAQNPSALSIISAFCGKNNTPLHIAKKPEIISSSIDHTEFSYNDENYKLQLHGLHQPQNAATAICTLQNLPIGIPNIAIRSALENSQMPARFEILQKNPYVILDGAHNTNGVFALCESIKEYFPQKVTMICGMLKDKNYAECARMLAPLCNLFIATTPESPRALSPDILCKEAELYCNNCVAIPDKNAAVKYALSHNKSDAIIICGSLYLMRDMPKTVANSR